MSRHQYFIKSNSKKVFDCALENAQFWVGNSKYYSGDDIFNILLLSAFERSSVEDVSTYLRTSNTSQIPSQDTILRVLDLNYRKMSLVAIENQISYNLQNMANLLPYFKHKRSKVVLALDLHDEVYFGEHIFDVTGRQITMIGHNRVLGKTRKVFRTATISIVKWGKQLSKPITIGFGINYKGQAREELVHRLFEQIAQLNLRVKYLTMDGGFASREVFQYLETQNIEFITRGRFSKKKLYPEAKNGFRYIMFRSGAEDYHVFGYICEIKRSGKDDQKIIFLSSKNVKKKEILRNYKHRFRIENTYRHAKSVKIRTSTRKPHLRWVFWGISLFIELIWEIIRHINDISRTSPYLSRQIEINRILRKLSTQYLAHAKYNSE